TNAPLILSVPGMEKAGSTTRSFTEFVDIYPTVAALCGLTTPHNLDGSSLVPLINDPTKQLKEAAFSMYPRGGRMGTTMRTDRFRFTVWEKKNDRKDVEYELYDHSIDPDENTNVINDPKYKAISTDLVALFHKNRPR